LHGGDPITSGVRYILAVFIYESSTKRETDDHSRLGADGLPPPESGSIFRHPTVTETDSGNKVEKRTSADSEYRGKCRGNDLVTIFHARKRAKEAAGDEVQSENETSCLRLDDSRINDSLQIPTIRLNNNTSQSSRSTFNFGFSFDGK